ncbi:4-hydroxy-2-oxovalerate aldolase [Streptomyces spectabilis]|uniref:4-hydroxy-2-oxovalerate aldolase n=1 Tax=Streptomyces spectabilis TaxID=68270 RepID=A0A7W8B248_STRST|nr:4-hydroxy-2-oxovalerate aldolase [Streptomyces spectabilis]MBB5108969.1 4-hydroxy 2-oxovalerate aldolase [Streptomyces spectabilis]GGV50425.1 4-hydroxy-2-oxovalerate aldolase [Streptomyces spectabilis]
MDSSPLSQLTVHDATLRDGQHAVQHQLDVPQLRAYAVAASAAGVPVVEVGHGNGLGASSRQIGYARLDDVTMLETVREALPAGASRMGVFMVPGWGTGADLRQAASCGADVVRIAAHCTETNVMRRHLGIARELDLEAQAVLLMSHMTGAERLAEECRRAVEYGAQAVGIMDSAGHYLPAEVTERINAIVTAVDVPVIFHGHNNLSMAVANSIAAVEAGARVIDACARGFGAGAGNTSLEVLVAVLHRSGHGTDIDLPGLLRAADLAHARLMDRPPVLDSASLASGLAGVFSGFKLQVLAAAGAAGVDPLEVFAELGRRQVVAGQEDLIDEVVRSLKAAS